MLPSSGRSIGEQSTTVLPSNRSIIVADSRFRGENAVDSPYNFNCDLSGTAIYAKEFYYQKLFWNQPIFSHSNDNCELRFQMNGNTAITYVVYATPFITHHEYDGNPPGQSLLTPQLYSYASNMEIGLNFDVRTIPNNTTPANGTGWLVDPTSPAHKITMCFRYAPARGFCIYPLQDSPTNGYYYSIRLVPCSYIAKAHFVHGFGVFNPNVSEIDYVPHDFFSTAIWSDTTPNLLPTRYIVIQSQELNKDRRLISFHNGNFASFVNELGIFSINPSRTGVFHEVGVGDDATVVSMRDEYTPQSFRIQILDERGQVIPCDDPLSNLLSSNGVDPSYTYSYFGGPYQGRGSPDFINYLVFGYRRMEGSLAAAAASGDLTYTVAIPNGMKGGEITYQPIDFDTLNVAQNLNLGLMVPLVLDGTPLSTLTPNPVPQAVGFNPITSNFASFVPNPGHNFTILTWYRDINPNPTARWDLEFQNFFTFVPANGVAYIYYCIFDAITFQVIMALRAFGRPTNGLAAPFIFIGASSANWVINPDYEFPPSPSTINIGIAVGWVGKPTGYIGNLNAMYGPATPIPPYFTIECTNNAANTQTEYVPPSTDYAYQFGDPLAGALCEEVIHEIAAVLEYN